MIIRKLDMNLLGLTLDVTNRYLYLLTIAMYFSSKYQYIVDGEFKKDMSHRMNAWKTILSNIRSQDRIKRNHELNNTEVYEFML